MFVVIWFAMVQDASEKFAWISGKLSANFQLPRVGATMDDAGFFSSTRPTKVLCLVKAASAATGSPFHVIDLIFSGAITISLTPICRSPWSASLDPEMLALRTR